MRKNYDKQFKAKVALEAVKEERTIAVTVNWSFEITSYC
jgi:hypothetical protein